MKKMFLFVLMLLALTLMYSCDFLKQVDQATGGGGGGNCSCTQVSKTGFYSGTQYKFSCSGPKGTRTYSVDTTNNDNEAKGLAVLACQSDQGMNP